MMVNKNLVYVGLAILGLLLLVGVIGTMRGMTGDVVAVGNKKPSSSAQDSMAGRYNGGVSVNSDIGDLSKYRSEDIPVDCRLPDYSNDVVGWAEHMGHHAETQFCLEYYTEVIASPEVVDSSGIPEKCKLPSGRDEASWVEHLGHHQETKECLEYFEDESVPLVVEDSLDMPEKCKLPVGKDEASWVQHLGHHQETKECLRYFE